MKALILFLLVLPIQVFGNLILFTENEPPFSMRKNELKGFRQDDPVTGISVDILNALFNRLKIPNVMRIDIWDNGYKLALTKDSFGIFSTTRTPEREELFKWVGPLVANDWVLVGKENFTEIIRKITDPILKNLRIGTLKGGAIEVFLRRNGISPIIFESGFDCALALKENKIDLWATGEPIANYYSKKIGAEKIKPVFLLKGHQFMYLALNIKTPDSLVEILNKELGVMRRDGTLRKIYLKYRGL